MVIVKFIYSYFKFKIVVLFGSFLVYDKYGKFINILPACDCELNLINQIIICHFEHSEGTPTQGNDSLNSEGGDNR